MELYDKMLSYVSGTSDKPLIGATIGDMFDRIAAQAPGNEALVSRHQGLRYTYEELRAEVDLWARGFMALGVQKGDRAGIWAPNCAEWLIAQLAMPKIGAMLVNINPAYRTHELEFVLNQSGVSTLITAPRFKSSDYVEMISQVCPELGEGSRGQLQAERVPNLRTVVVLGEERFSGTLSWRDIGGMGSEVTAETLRARQARQTFDDPINIQYTSGTTGFPKGATLSHHSILNNGFFIGERMRFSPSDRLANCPPLYHCFGSVLGNLACLTHGATIVFPSDGFDPRAALEAVQEERCTALHGVPTMFIAELSLPEFATYDLSSLRTGIMAGSPCPIEVMKQVVEQMHMTEVTICYGMTETSPVSTQTTSDDPIDLRVSTVGRVHPHVEIKIVDPDSGGVVPRGAPGELCARGYLVMLGYWNDPEATSLALDAGRWMHTGDLATMNEEGYVKIVGRIKDVIIRGGENIYPREIEEFLYGHPAIQDVQVVGVPDDTYGEQVMAWIILKPGKVTTEEEIREFCQGAIAHYKIPRYVRFVSEYPVTISGKIQKYKLRAQATEELGLSRVAVFETT